MSTQRPGFFRQLFSKWTLGVIGLCLAQFLLGIVLALVLHSGDFPNLTGPLVSFFAVVELVLYMSVSTLALLYQRRVSERFMQ